MRIISYVEAGSPRLGVMTGDETFAAVAELDPSLPHTLDALLVIPDGLNASPPKRPARPASTASPMRRWACSCSSRTGSGPSRSTSKRTSRNRIDDLG